VDYLYLSCDFCSSCSAGTVREDCQYNPTMEYPEYPAADQGKYQTCGDFAQRIIHPSEPAIREADESARNRWPGDWVIQRGYGDVQTIPICYVKAAHLDAERTGKKGMDENQAVMSIIREDRRCKKWTPYIPGFSPKERFEQYQAEQTEQDRRTFAQRQEDGRRQFELRTQADSKWFQIKTTIFLALVALLAVPWSQWYGRLLSVLDWIRTTHIPGLR